MTTPSPLVFTVEADGLSVSRRIQADDGSQASLKRVGYLPGLTARDGFLRAGPGTLRLDIDASNDHPPAVGITGIRLSGVLVEDARGLAFTQGQLTGYVTRRAFVDMLNGMRQACLGDPGSDVICRNPWVSHIIGATTGCAEVPLAAQWVSGFDVGCDDRRARECDPEIPGDCNALGVCMLLEVEGGAPAEE